MRTRLIFLFFILGYLPLSAQTTGPTQPEAAGFKEVSADNLVNLYTGNFNYNIPLMVVPGPDGGYPINLFYSGNVSMEQAASWAGLGWNLNCGAIQRNLRGLPDDFRGNEITKEFYTKPSTTISIDITPKVLSYEIFGAEWKKALGSLGQNYRIYYNNYTGLGVSAGISLATKVDEDGKTSKGVSGSLALSFDSQSGISLSPSVSFSRKNQSANDFYVNGTSNTLSLGARLNSKQGFGDLNLRQVKQKYQGLTLLSVLLNTSNLIEIGTNSSSRSVGISFASAAPLSRISTPRTTISAAYSTEIDLTKGTISSTKENPLLSVNGTLTRSWVTNTEKKAPAYGAMYMAYRQGDDAITDFYRENEGPITKDNIITPIPVLTYDVFSIQGHGIGGSFRAYQNSVGKLSDPIVHSNSASGGLGSEFGSGGAFKFGVTLDGSFTRSYSGPWRDKSRFQSNLDEYTFEPNKTGRPLFEPFYFKMIGETQPLPLAAWQDVAEDDPLAFDIRLQWDAISAKVKALGSLNHGNRSLGIDKYPARQPRVHSIEYFTRKDLRYPTPHVIRENTNALSPIPYAGTNDYSLEALSVLKPNGVRYNYFLPAYNIRTEKVTFAIPGTTSGNPKTITRVNGKDVLDYAVVNNGAGEDEFYSKEVIPQYAHTFFLTSILSQDYVDVDNNGPSDNDLGSYVKFIYDEVADYHWRFPYEGAYFTKGYASNPDDNKASYQAGTKDLYYVRAIETKTHVAVFATTDSSLKDHGNTERQKQLVSISLYSKSDPDYQQDFYLNSSGPQPAIIQKVHFHINDHLRQNTPNSANGYSPALDSLHFTYYDSRKGEDAKYIFRYGENPPYQDHMQDRWGTYQEDRPGDDLYVHENPYTYQDKYPDRDAEAAAWLMDEIVLPSKGRIEVDYEKDDYAYVQDRPASSFVKLVGSGDGSSTYDVNFDKDEEFLYFESPYPLNRTADVAAQLKDLDYVRFRVHLDLKFSDRLFGPASDYVEGYAKIIPGFEGVVSGTNIGYFKIERIKPKSTSTYTAHPIRLAAWQYIRRSRPDLGVDFGDLSNIHPVVFATRNALAMINELGNLITGYYTNAWIKGWAKSMDNSRPSYVRLVNPLRKYGGDTRVKRITLHSNDPQNPTYGQEYEYQLPTGQSSGVAEFEPLLGLEECLFTQPVWYNPNNDGTRIIFSNEQAFHEEPLGAGLYPSAQVGYSRVVVRNLPAPGITRAQSGVNVSEFFTARDFPTRFDSYGARLKEYPVKVLIPFIGMQSFNNNGYSMGYSFTLNNAIYGRPKSEATYPYQVGALTGQPVQKSVYRYKTSPRNSQILDNQVVSLRQEGVKEKVLLGREVDFYIDEIEANTWGLQGGSNFNLNVQSPAFLPSWFPSLSYQESNTRYLTTNKVTFNIPVLDQVEQYKDGAKVTTQNLFYDYETGDAIITAVTNEWDSLIYTYSFPAHWTYEQMKGAATNYRAELTLQLMDVTTGSFQVNHGLVSGRIPRNLLQNGDVVRFPSLSDNFYVTALDRDNNRFRLTNRAGSPPSGSLGNVSQAIIVESGFQNLQSTRKGQIVSLQDWSDYQPVQGNSFTGSLPLVYNQNQPGFPSTTIPLRQPIRENGRIDRPFTLFPCQDVDFGVSYAIASPENRLRLTFFDSCTAYLDLDLGRNSPGVFDLAKLRFEEPSQPAQLYMIYTDPSSSWYGKRFPLQWEDNSGCPRCFEPDPITVLHADATEFSENWALNYQELETEETERSGVTLSAVADGSALGNPYAYGMRGIWRPWRTSAYLIDRKQSGTNGDSTRIDEDGEYEEFYWFDWKSPITYNEEYHWRWVNEVTQYNVNGQSKEGRNRLDIYAASLFGYQNHLVTATASNSQTTDIAYDGFEDYKAGEPINHGNMSFNATSTVNLIELAHTGNSALSIGTPTNFSTNSIDHFTPQAGKTYVISCWVYIGDIPAGNISYNGGEIEVREGTSLLASIKPNFTTNQVIDGWMKIEGTFVPSTSNIQISLIPKVISSPILGGQGALFDDLRIQPFNSGMETYVYDPTNYRLLATLSNQNYATFYNYDEEGNLIQTKVETERGIKTITQNRSNIQK